MGTEYRGSANSVSFKSHSISVTFNFCTMRIVLCTLEPRSTDSLGTQHCTNFESHSNRVTFETNAIMVIVKVHPHCPHVQLGWLLQTQAALVYMMSRGMS